jgi:hypothetical protein
MASGWDLRKPCVDCPFLRSNMQKFNFTYDRAEQLADVARMSTFDCHKTVDFVEDENGESDQRRTAKTQVCAGSLIAMELDEESSQMMRIAERTGVYDHTKLDYTSDVLPISEWE